MFLLRLSCPSYWSVRGASVADNNDNNQLMGASKTLSLVSINTLNLHLSTWEVWKKNCIETRVMGIFLTQVEKQIY